MRPSSSPTIGARLPASSSRRTGYIPRIPTQSWPYFLPITFLEGDVFMRHIEKVASLSRSSPSGWY